MGSGGPGRRPGRRGRLAGATPGRMDRGLLTRALDRHVDPARAPSLPVPATSTARGRSPRTRTSRCERDRTRSARRPARSARGGGRERGERADGPAPVTSTLSPSATPPVLTADHDTAVGSIIAPCSQLSASASGTWSASTAPGPPCRPRDGGGRPRRADRTSAPGRAGRPHTHRSCRAASPRRGPPARASRRPGPPRRPRPTARGRGLGHVPAGERMRLDRRPQRPGRVLVHIGAADTGEHRRDRPGCRPGDRCLRRLMPRSLAAWKQRARIFGILPSAW